MKSKMLSLTLSALCSVAMLGEVALADAVLDGFSGRNFTHGVQLTGDAANSMMLGLTAIGVKSNDVTYNKLPSITCNQVSSAQNATCRTVFGDQNDSPYLTVQPGSALDKIFQLLLQNGDVEQKGENGAVRTYPTQIQCWNIAGTTCQLQYELSYSVDTFTVDSALIPEVNTLMDNIPTNLNVARTESGFLVYTIDRMYRGSAYYKYSPTIYYTSLVSNDKQGYAIDDGAFQMALNVILAARPARGLSHNSGNVQLYCVRTLSGANPAICTVTERSGM